MPQKIKANSSQPSYDTVSSSYETYVKNHLSSTDKYPYGSYMMYDINNDGIYEMFFTYMSGVRSGYQIYTYKNGKVVKLKAITGCSCIYYNKQKKQICVLLSGGAADNAFICYKMNSNKLTKISKYESISSYSEPTPKIKYFKIGKKISQKVYAKYTDKINEWNRIQNFEYDENIKCQLITY